MSIANIGISWRLIAMIVPSVVPRDLRCEIGEGYYCSRPMPPAQFDVWLRDHPLGLAVNAA